METTNFPRDGAADSFTPTGFDRYFRRSVVGARALSRISSTVELPETVELPTDRPALIVANHASLFDLIAALVTLGNYGVVARLGVNARFFAYPVAGGFLQRLGCIPFSRETREEAEQAMVDALLAGQICGMMPEGRIVRHEDQIDGVGPARPGVSRIARRTGAALVPVGFAQSDLAWPPGSALIRVGPRRPPVVVSLGSPVTLESDDHVANAEVVMRAISEQVLRARQLAISGP